MAALAGQTAVPPANDSFANRVALNGTAATATANVGGATNEPFEPANVGDNTVWYTYTAPADGTVQILTAGSTYPNIISVYQGDSLANLARVTSQAYSANDSSYAAGDTFATLAGQVYQICIGANGPPANDSLALAVSLLPATLPTGLVQTPAAGNDFFINRTTLTGETVSGLTYSLDATTEPFEPDGVGRSTVWWTWTAPATGNVQITTQGTSYSDYLYVFTGDNLATLRTVGSGQGSASAGPAAVALDVTRGTTYQICVGASDDGGTALVNLALSPRPILAVTKPKAASPAVVSSAGFRLRGTAVADAGLAAVQYKLPGGAYQNATIEPNGAWKITFGVVPAFEEFNVTLRARDGNGRLSSKFKLRLLPE